jgi:dihydrofolate reductase
MRKIIVAAFLSLDGVAQAPGKPDEDPSGGFCFGGWLPPHIDEVAMEAVDDLLTEPYALLLGRKTYDIFAGYWPKVTRDPAAPYFNERQAEISRMFDRITKYVATHRPDSLEWQNTQSLGTSPAQELRRIKQEDGPPLVTQGSTELVHLLLANGLVDELRLMTFPILLGKGKRLFDGDAAAATFKQVKSTTGPKGVVVTIYEKVGGVETGSFEAPKQ